MRIGIAGTGRMGSAMAARLMSFGHEFAVWNRTAEEAKPLVAAGARVTSTPVELASSSELVITILTNAEAIEAVWELGYASPVAECTLRCFDEASRAGRAHQDDAMLPMRWLRGPQD